jgi:hypothetical protein
MTYNKCILYMVISSPKRKGYLEVGKGVSNQGWGFVAKCKGRGIAVDGCGWVVGGGG